MGVASFFFIAPSIVPYPEIQGCTFERYCFKEISNNAVLVCSIKNSRPAVPLSWAMRTVEGDRNITIAVESLPNEEYFTTVAKMRYQHISHLHHFMFVCEAIDPKSLLDSDVSFVVAEVTQTNVDVAHAVFITLKIDDSVSLPLPGQDNLFFVWKKFSLRKSLML